MKSTRSFSDDDLIEALKSMTNSQAAKHFDVSKRQIERRRAALVRKGWSPAHDLHHAVPDGYMLKGASTLYKEGKPVLQWVKSTVDEERQRELFESSCKAAVKDLPVVVPKEARGKHVDHLMTVYPIGDPHFGEYIWGDECGRDWDLSIAERIHCQAMAALVDAAPNTDRAKDWGETIHRYWYTGHIHHESKKEFPGCVVESFNTLAPADSYAHSGGYRARQNMKCVVLHKEHGEVARHTVSPDMLEGEAA